MKKTTITLVDDHKMIREMWNRLFTGHPDFEIVGEARTFDEAIELLKIKRPDIVLLDINLLDASGMDAVPLIRKFTPGTKIIFVSMHNQPAFAKKAIQLGAKGYITKNSSQAEIFKALDTVNNGGVYICQEIKDNLSMRFLDSEPDSFGTKELSIREIEIIKLIKKGLSSKEISGTLNISTRTVEVHRHNILKKLKLKNTASLIGYINNSDLGFH